MVTKCYQKRDVPYPKGKLSVVVKCEQERQCDRARRMLQRQKVMMGQSSKLTPNLRTPHEPRNHIISRKPKLFQMQYKDAAADKIE